MNNILQIDTFPYRKNFMSVSWFSYVMWVKYAQWFSNNIKDVKTIKSKANETQMKPETSHLHLIHGLALFKMFMVSHINRLNFENWTEITFVGWWIAHFYIQNRNSRQSNRSEGVFLLFHTIVCVSMYILHITQVKRWY